MMGSQALKCIWEKFTHVDDQFDILLFFANDVFQESI